MSLYSDLMKTNPPRLVVLFRRGDDGSEQFEWGIVGKFPSLTLLGCIHAAQDQLSRGEWTAECENEQPAFAIALDLHNQEVEFFKHPDIPIYPLVGMLETIKEMLTASKVSKHVASQNFRLMGPDGTPLRKINEG